MSPLSVKPNKEKLNSKTNVVWPHIITNWVTTCEKSSSIPVIPHTRQRSSIPSFRSINMAPEVNATDKKKMIVRITPGAAKSVKFGFSTPYIGDSHLIGMCPSDGFKPQSDKIWSIKVKYAYCKSRHSSCPICWSEMKQKQNREYELHVLSVWRMIKF